jgi:OFA family oxalate/formate antiporter-like MFS transporter
LSGLAPGLTALYLTHGVLGGVGLGLGYIVPLAVLIGWFPDKRGFITGLAVTGFGLGALVTGPLRRR